MHHPKIIAPAADGPAGRKLPGIPLPAPTKQLINRLAADTPKTLAKITAWLPGEPEQAAAAISILREHGDIVRISGKDDADVYARWTASYAQIKRAMAEASANETES
jgi:hypothetical protein